MSSTTIASGSALAVKKYSQALAAMAVREPTPLKMLRGPMSTEDKALRKIRQQTSTDMPIVEITDLSKGAGDVVQLNCAHVIKLRAIMGDRNAEGLGAPLDWSTQDIKINVATIPVSAGGQMTQQRTQHSLRANALAQLKGGMPRFRWQRCQVMLAGARGVQNSNDWIVPLASDPFFAEQMVNTVKAPTYNRHWVASGATLVQGGLQVASVATTDTMKLSMLDEFAAIWGEMGTRMAPIQIPGDPAAADDPIKGLLLIDPLVWDALITDTTASNNIRTFETNAMKRANYGNLKQHPLFSGSPILWNGILMRPMTTAIRFNASDAYQYVAVADRLTGNETTGAVAAALSTTHQLARSIFLGAQALGCASGANQASDESYTLLENRTNFGRNLEFAGEIMGAEQKLRWSLPNSNGDLEATDFGVAIIDSVVRRRPVN